MRQVTNYFESLVKVTDILPRKCHIWMDYNDVHDVPIFRRFTDPQKPILPTLGS